MATVAKFRCNNVKSYGSAQPSVVEFSPVYDANTEENQRFTKYTPAGSLSMTVDNPAVVFKPGTFYYLTFEEAEE